MIGRYEGFAKSYFDKPKASTAVEQLKEYIKENLFNVSDIADAVAERFKQLSEVKPAENLKHVERLWLAVKIMREERMTEEAKDIFNRVKESVSNDSDLLRAGYEKCGELVKLIHENGVSLITADFKSGSTLMHYAVMDENAELVGWLIREGAEVDGKLHDNCWTPLHLASSRGYKKIVRQLLDAKADLNSLTHMGDSPIYLATNEGHHGAVGELVKGGAKNLDGKDGAARNAMHLAAFKNDDSLVIKLALSGAYPSIVDWEQKRFNLALLQTAFLNIEPKEEKETPLASAPRDIQGLFLRYLPLSAQLNARQVCKAWNHIVVQQMVSEVISLSSKAPDHQG